MKNNITTVPFRFLFIILLSVVVISCKETTNTTKKAPSNKVLWVPYNDSLEIAANAEHENERMRYKLVQSKVLDKNEVFQPLYEEVLNFSEERYVALSPLILEQNINIIQEHISAQKFTYEELVLFYLKRIYKYELDNETTLNTVIALNPNVLEEARDLAKNKEGKHPIYGMPILLKDNIESE